MSPGRRRTAVVRAIWFGLRNGRVEESKMASSVSEERDFTLGDLGP
jgi:hypothetical protein